MTKRYSEQFKQEGLSFVQTHPSSGIATIVKRLGVGYSTLDNWLRQHRVSIGSGAAYAINDERQRIRALEKQVAHLTEVNDILKKSGGAFNWWLQHMHQVFSKRAKVQGFPWALI